MSNSRTWKTYDDVVYVSPSLVANYARDIVLPWDTKYYLEINDAVSNTCVARMVYTSIHLY